jgi:large subunit ribosomal protein L29
MRAADLREKSPEDLQELHKSLIRDVFQNRLKNFTNRLDDTSSIRKTKRDLARVVTLLRERELGVVRTAAPVRAPEPAEKPAEEAKAKAERAPKKAKAAASAPEAKAKTKKVAAVKESAGSASAGKVPEAPKKKSSKKSGKSEAK